MATLREKDHYFVIPADPHAGIVVVGERAIMLPADTARVYDLRTRAIVWEVTGGPWSVGRVPQSITRRPLVPTTGIAANSLMITCFTCPARAAYGIAVDRGWTYDPAGPSFLAYYCPTCTTAREGANYGSK